MTADPFTVKPDATLLEAHELMLANDVRRLPVVDDEGDLLGIITESDIHEAQPYSRMLESAGTEMAHLVEESGGLVREVMAAEPVTVAPEDRVQTAAERMLEFEISGLPVVESSKLVGIITESDIFRLVVESWSQQDRA